MPARSKTRTGGRYEAGRRAQERRGRRVWWQFDRSHRASVPTAASPPPAWTEGGAQGSALGSENTSQRHTIRRTLNVCVVSVCVCVFFFFCGPRFCFCCVCVCVCVCVALSHLLNSLFFARCGVWFRLLFEKKKGFCFFLYCCWVFRGVFFFFFFLNLLRKKETKK
eukprot:TRINITY_DN6373_c1_g1_i3.p2 TRINITY_DN6373_c1_g1~~TRINITY_DN6373_c1_g1_i3.p2  ORF type:complete len:166 (-),score=0.02 TRINITY_DN6373_c1_g1_i3:9-506(-)